MSKVSDFLYRVSIWAVALLMGVMMIVTLVDVFARNVLGFSFPWAGELARFILIWVTFIGASAAYKRLEMPGFDMIANKVSEKMTVIIFKVTHLVVLLFSGMIVYAGFTQSFSKTVSLQISAGLEISMTYPYLAIPVGMSFLLIHAIAFLFSAKPERKEYTL